MMYQNKFVTAIKTNGKVLREQGENVFIPFGSEYSIYLKNLNSVRASVRVWVDGVEATDGCTLIVNAYDDLNLERFIKDANFNAGNRFKFIERSAKVEQHRGVGTEDGLIRVEFQFERQPDPIFYPSYPRATLRSYDPGVKLKGLSSPPATYTTCSNSVFGGDVQMSATFASVEPQAFLNSAVAQNSIVNDVGITVPGSVSDQKFHSVSSFPMEYQKHVIVMNLRGAVGEQPVTQPVTVKHKPTCTSCGTVNKGNAKFCRECGTGLTLV